MGFLSSADTRLRNLGALALARVGDVETGRDELERMKALPGEEGRLADSYLKQEEIRRYYDRNTPSFVALGQGGGVGAIHRAVWGPGASTREQAFHFVEDRIADVVARTIAAPAEVPLGVLTALVGSPFFFWLLRRTRARQGRHRRRRIAPPGAYNGARRSGSAGVAAPPRTVAA